MKLGCLRLLRLYSKRNVVYCMGPYAGADYKNISLTLSRELSTSTTRVRSGGNGCGRSLLLVWHICICLLIMEQPIGKRRSQKGGGNWWELYALEYKIYGAWGNPMPELSLTPLLS
jgi:hypothetical protein